MNKKMLFALQFVAACIIGGAGVLKFLGNPTDMLVFATLEMEPFGRYLIGTLELVAGGLLLSSSFAASGALLALGTMIGAAIAHVTVLGFEVQGDGGLHIALLSTVLVSCGSVLLQRRRELPLIGHTL